MGETRADRCDLAFSLKEIGANVVPVNILNPNSRHAVRQETIPCPSWKF